MWTLAIMSLATATLSFLSANKTIQVPWIWIASSFSWLPLLVLTTAYMLQRTLREYRTAVLRNRTDWYKPSVALRGCLCVATFIGLASYFWQAS